MWDYEHFFDDCPEGINHRASTHGSFEDHIVLGDYIYIGGCNSLLLCLCFFLGSHFDLDNPFPFAIANIRIMTAFKELSEFMHVSLNDMVLLI